VGAADTGEHFSFELAGTPEAGAAARRALVAGNGALPANVRDDVLLLLTEVVTNAVRHGSAGPDPRVRVELRQWSRTVRVAVHDEGPGFAAEAADEGNGWGLLLVDRVADSWAVTPTASGTCVWFEIRYGESAAGHRVAPSYGS
jgi:two-component sensor histidine kinase